MILVQVFLWFQCWKPIGVLQLAIFFKFWTYSIHVAKCLAGGRRVREFMDEMDGLSWGAEDQEVETKSSVLCNEHILGSQKWRL